jgi:hypothetical protein
MSELNCNSVQKKTKLSNPLSLLMTKTSLSSFSLESIQMDMNIVPSEIQNLSNLIWNRIPMYSIPFEVIFGALPEIDIAWKPYVILRDKSSIFVTNWDIEPSYLLIRIINMYNNFNQSLLYVACRRCYYEFIQVALKIDGINKNILNGDKSNPTMGFTWALASGESKKFPYSDINKTFMLLIKNGFDFKYLNTKGETPFDFLNKKENKILLLPDLEKYLSELRDNYLKLESFIDELKK